MFELKVLSFVPFVSGLANAALALLIVAFISAIVPPSGIIWLKIVRLC